MYSETVVSLRSPPKQTRNLENNKFKTCTFDGALVSRPGSVIGSLRPILPEPDTLNANPSTQHPKPKNSKTKAWVESVGFDGLGVGFML